MNNDLQTLYATIENIGTAMMTTRRPDGHLQSRAMANQKPASGADLWFVTTEGTAKLADLSHDPHVNLCVLPRQQRRVDFGVGRGDRLA